MDIAPARLPSASKSSARLCILATVFSLFLLPIMFSSQANAANNVTGNLFTNPSFESNTSGWGTWGAGVASNPDAQAVEGKRVAKVTGTFFNTTMYLNSLVIPTDSIVPGACTFSANVRLDSGASRSAYLVLNERNGWGVVKQYKSQRMNLNNVFQQLSVSGYMPATAGDTLDVSIIMDNVSFWGGEAFSADALSLTCATLPLHVHMGDSYFAGSGASMTPLENGKFAIDNSVYAPSGGTLCYRSNNNNAQIISAQMHQRLRDVSCGGASTYDITDGNQWWTGVSKPQITAVTPDAKLVTVAIGGNDVQILNVITCAVKEAECNRNSQSIQSSYSLIEPTRAKVRKVLAQIVQRAPDAEVRLVNLPYMLPLPGSSAGSCGNVITQGEMQMGKDFQDAFTAMEKGVASEFGPKVQFVDLTASDAPFYVVDQYGDRGYCSTSPNRWINGYADNKASGNNGSDHPNSRGQQYYAEMLIRSLQNIPTLIG